MLYRLEVENFFSIRDAQVLDLIVAPNVPDPDGRFAPIFDGAELRAPKVVALYGANASGKTTILKALSFLFQFVANSSQRVVPGFFTCERFNDEESRSRPIRLAVELGGIMHLNQDVLARASRGEPVETGTYRYELELACENGAPARVMSEALRQRPNGQGKWQRIFERDENRNVKDSKIFSLTGFHHLLNTLNPNVSIISSFALFQHPGAILFAEEVRKSTFLLGPAPAIQDQALINYLASHPTVLDELNKELRRIDVGVEAMKFIESPNGPQAFFTHSGLEVDMPWLLESHGTHSFIKIFPAIAEALKTGSICAIDEFDSSIHPLVLPEVINWFYGISGRNPYDGQLWFTCHSASLLDDLNKEEIVICEKDRLGRTALHSLMDVKVRRDDNHYKKYLSGAYGGVPQIG